MTDMNFVEGDNCEKQKRSRKARLGVKTIWANRMPPFFKHLHHAHHPVGRRDGDSSYTFRVGSWRSNMTLVPVNRGIRAQSTRISGML